MKTLLLPLLLLTALGVQAQNFNDIINSTKQVLGTVNDATKTGSQIAKEANANKRESDANKAAANNNNSAANTTTTTPPPPPTPQSTIILQQCDYQQVKELYSSLLNCPLAKTVEKTFSGNSASLQITHTGTTDALLDFIETNLPGKYTVQALQKGNITLSTRKN